MKVNKELSASMGPMKRKTTLLKKLSIKSSDFRTKESKIESQLEENKELTNNEKSIIR